MPSKKTLLKNLTLISGFITLLMPFRDHRRVLLAISFKLYQIYVKIILNLNIFLLNYILFLFNVLYPLLKKEDIFYCF